ncbi:MAG: zinc ABC transporter solute-binding protein [Oscillatoriales cyanobacterium RU_3_3]|nr:zinc ABC transporter solute-binding protein [Microcoleus sp. SU_5_6]NJM60947.1 zinc ABC transporter solute-binding protein [Oscillatoriales cyanobacterium RU_3_3]
MIRKINFKTVALFSMTVVTAVSSNILPTASQTSRTPASIAQNRPQVVATSSVICGLTKEIAGSTIDLKCLVGAGSDPHVYQAKPADRAAIDRAKLILYNGYDFEPSLIKLIKASSNKAPKVAVAEQAVPNPLMAEDEGHSHGGHSHGGHSHGAGKKVADPHVWHDAKNGMAMAKVISNQLSKVVPDRAAVYNSNTQKITGEIARIDSWIKSQISTIPAPNRKLVTTHDALSYYSKAYGIPVASVLEGISTDEMPAAARIATLVKEIRASGVPTIFVETTVNPKLIETVARESKVRVSPRDLFADGLGEAGGDGDTYQKMLVANTRTIVEGLGGKYSAFKP